MFVIEIYKISQIYIYILKVKTENFHLEKYKYFSFNLNNYNKNICDNPHVTVILYCG